MGLGLLEHMLPDRAFYWDNTVSAIFMNLLTINHDVKECFAKNFICKYFHNLLILKYKSQTVLCSSFSIILLLFVLCDSTCVDRTK